MVVSDSVTVKVNSFCLSLASELTTDLLTSSEPVLRVLVNTAFAVSSAAMLPVAPLSVVVKFESAVSTTVYSTVEGSPAAVLFSPPFRAMLATPFSNVMPP